MSLFTTVQIRASSWDTQQRLPYNRNAPRKIKRPGEELSVATTSTAISNLNSARISSITETRTPKEIDVNELLKLKTTIFKQDSEEATYLGYERWLPSSPKVEKPRSTYNAAALAYIGDCIYELYARRHFLSPALNIEEYNGRVMAVVRCEAQDALLQKLLGEKLLSNEERDVLRWGKNVTSAKTRTKKRAGVAAYNRASSLETLIGYLYLTNVARLDEVMLRLGFSVGVSYRTIVDDLNREMQNMKQKQQNNKSRLL